MTINNSTTTLSNSNENLSQPQYNPNKLSADLLSAKGLNLQTMERYLNEAFPKIETAKDKDLVLVLGNTGAGKSTTVNYLLGCEMEMEREEGMPIKARSKGKVFADTSEGNESHTFSPQAYLNKTDKLIYCDFPGFEDNRTPEERVSISIHTQIAIESAKSIQAVMIIIESTSFITARGADFSKLTKTLSSLFQHPEVVMPSVLLVITKVDPKDINEKAKLNFIKKLEEQKERLDKALKKYEFPTLNALGTTLGLTSTETNNEPKQKITQILQQKSIIEGMLKHEKNIILINIFDNGACKNEIVSSLKRINAIDKKLFNFTKYDEFRMEFNKILTELAQKGSVILEKYIELPKKIAAITREIAESEKSRTFYSEQIKLLESRSKVFSEEASKSQQALIKNQLSASIANIKDKETQLAKLKKRIQELEQERQELSSTEQAKLRYFVDDPRQTWQTFLFPTIFAWTEHQFRYPYQNTPFEQVKEHYENGHLCDRQVDEKKGIYCSTYKSNYYKDGKASVEFFIQKKNIPDNKKRVSLIEKVIPEKKAELEEIHADLKEKNIEIQRLESVLDRLQKGVKENEESIQRQLHDCDDKREKLEQKIPQLNAELNETKQNFQGIKLNFDKNQSLFRAVQSMLKLGLLKTNQAENSPFATEFLRQWQRILEISGNNAAPSASHVNSSENASETIQPPAYFVCPINKKLMQDPVIIDCGDSFERQSISKYLEKHDKCFCCNNPITNKQRLIANKNLGQAIEEWKNSIQDQLTHKPGLAPENSNNALITQGETLKSSKPADLQPLAAKEEKTAVKNEHKNTVPDNENSLKINQDSSSTSAANVSTPKPKPYQPPFENFKRKSTYKGPYKTRECSFFNLSKGCNKGSSCTFSHIKKASPYKL